MPKEKPFFLTISKIFERWKEREFDEKRFRDDFIHQLRGLCVRRCADVLDQDILTDEFLVALDVCEWFRKIMEEPIDLFVTNFLLEYSDMIIESTRKKQNANAEGWREWAFGEARADTLATDINAMMESGVQLIFQSVFTMATKEAKRAQKK